MLISIDSQKKQNPFVKRFFGQRKEKMNLTILYGAIKVKLSPLSGVGNIGP